MTEKQLRQIIREEVRRNLLSEADVIPKGPDGQEITDPKIIKNLNMALKAIGGNIRGKIIDMIEDPDSVKELTNAGQKAAVMAAMAIAFGITSKEFGQIVTKVKAILPEE
jgi:hypothetical protein